MCETREGGAREEAYCRECKGEGRTAGAPGDRRGSNATLQEDGRPSLTDRPQQHFVNCHGEGALASGATSEMLTDPDAWLEAVMHDWAINLLQGV